MEKPYLGIWVDHREAYLIWADESGEVEVHHTAAEYPETGQKADRAMSSGGRAFGAMAPHAHLEEKQHREARRFYDQIFRAVRKAPSVYIFGPGKARNELRKRLQEHKGFAGEVRAVESAEKMSQPQMAARVREFFGLPRSPG